MLSAVFSMLLIALTVFATAVTAAFVPTNWQGTYNDPIYGGNIALCVSESSGGIYYGQALFSNVGYMRGTINPATLAWVGSFFTAGFEVKHGTFSLTLGTGTTGNATLTGSFSELPGIDYSLASTRWSSAVPGDFDCFRSDLSLLTTSTVFDFTGAWYDPAATIKVPYYLAIDGSVSPPSSTGSYVYYFSDGTPSPGVGTGTANLYGQVVSNNWYESGSSQGLDLFVAKNTTYAYILWWYFSRMSDFDYSYVSDPFYYGKHAYARNASVSTSTAIQKSTETMCYALWTAAAEQSCTASTTVIVDDDNDDGSDSNGNGGKGLLIAILVVATLTFFAGLITMFSVLTANKKASLASQQAQSHAVEMSKI